MRLRLVFLSSALLCAPALHADPLDEAIAAEMSAAIMKYTTRLYNIFQRKYLASQ